MFLILFLSLTVTLPVRTPAIHNHSPHIKSPQPLGLGKTAIRRGPIETSLLRNTPIRRTNPPSRPRRRPRGRPRRHPAGPRSRSRHGPASPSRKPHTARAPPHPPPPDQD